MYEVSLEEAQLQFMQLIQKAMQGQEIIITQGNVPKVKLVSLRKPKKNAKFGSAKGMITMSDDFDAPLDDFKEYVL